LPDTSLVFDVHVFLGAISEKEESFAKAYDIMIEKHHKFFINNDIEKRYSSISRKYGMTPLIIRRKLEYLKQIGILKKRYRKKVKIDGFTADDLTFLETACHGASYLLTRDPDFHDNKKKIRRAGCRFEVTSPDGYVHKCEK
jgi:uncharacterized LabA/DUF88 family protein